MLDESSLEAVADALRQPWQGENGQIWIDLRAENRRRHEAAMNTWLIRSASEYRPS